MGKKTGPKGSWKYKKEMCDLVVEMGRQGKSRTQIAAALDITFQTMINWEKDYPEFLEATTRAYELSMARWEDIGLEGLWATTETYTDDNGKQQKVHKAINAQMFGLQMRNRFPEHYRDRVDYNHNHQGKIEHEHDGDTRDLARRILHMLYKGNTEAAKLIEHEED
jgi:hypothetical protein